MTSQQEEQLRLQAQVRGYDAQTTERFIEFAKQKEQQSQPVVQPNPQKQAGEGFVKSFIKSAASPFLRLGATAQAFGTSKILGGPGANTSENNIPFFGPQKPITTAKDAALVGSELALEAVGGEVVGRVIKGAAKGAKALFNQGPKTVEAVSKGVSQTVQRATSTLDEGTKTALNPLRKLPEEARSRMLASAPKIEARQVAMQQRLDKYVKQAQKAVQDYSQETPLELAGREAENALKLLDEKLIKQGQLKTQALDKVGKLRLSKLSDVRNTLRDLLIERTGTGLSVKGDLVRIAGRQSAIPDADVSLIKTVERRLRALGNNPTLREVDDTIDYIQAELYKRQGVGAIPVDSKVVGILKQVTGQLNNRVKKIAGSSYRTANSKYAYFIDTREKLNKALGIDATKGGSLMKRVFSPTDGGTKKLFAEIRKLTGIDLTEEATLARFAMEKVGDSRQASLLEQLQLLKPQGTLGMVENAAKYLLDKAKDPIKEASRIIQEGKLSRP